MSNKKSKILRYKQDLVPVSVVSFCFLLSLLSVLYLTNTIILVINWVFAFTIKNSVLPAQHNHAHLKVFKNNKLNFIYDVIIAQTTGYTTPEWELQHNIGHHRNFMNPENDTASTIHHKTNKTMSSLEYIYYGSLSSFPDALKIAKNERESGNNKPLSRLLLHVFLQVIITLILLICNFKAALFFFVISNLLARSMVWWGTYWHHADVPRTNVYDSSFTCTNKFLNTIAFNNGYHTVHHEKPTLHWSLLPERTEVIRNKIPDRCISDKIPG